MSTKDLLLVEPPPASGAQRLHASVAARPAEPPASILLVDDRQDKLLALEAVLAPLGQNIVKAHSGKEALRRLLQQDFAVILLDVVMPEMDGFETAALIRQRLNSERTPILFVTGIDNAEKHIARGYSLGAVDYLLTPIVPEVLKAKVSVFVELYKQTAEIRRLNRELEQRMAELRKAFHELEGFSYSITHDMRAPLRAMHSYISLLQEECSGSLEVQHLDFLQRIKGAVYRMDRLIQDALDYSKVLREQLPVHPVEIGRILREMVATYPNLEPLQADIAIEVEDLLVLGNEAGLTQCFSNLLGNAVKFVSPGVRPRVRVWAEWVHGPRSGCEAPGGDSGGERIRTAPHPAPPSSRANQPPAPSVRVWFEDNGIGIAQEAHQRIFDMFQRLHSDKDFPGTGIGLAIVAKAMERMGGQVGVKSAPGRGSRFWLELRAASPEPTAS